MFLLILNWGSQTGRRAAISKLVQKSYLSNNEFQREKEQICQKLDLKVFFLLLINKLFQNN